MRLRSDWNAELFCFWKTTGQRTWTRSERVMQRPSARKCTEMSDWLLVLNACECKKESGGGSRRGGRLRRGGRRQRQVDAARVVWGGEGMGWIRAVEVRWTAVGAKGNREN